jgi:hypothetical protein
MFAKKCLYLSGSLRNIVTEYALDYLLIALCLLPIRLHFASCNPVCASYLWPVRCAKSKTNNTDVRTVCEERQLRDR